MEPKYKYGDVVEFHFLDIFKEGVIEIVDAHGYFGQTTNEPSYDIYCEADSTLYKHIEESYITRKIKSRQHITRGILQYHPQVGFTVLFSREGYEAIIDRTDMLIRRAHEKEWMKSADVNLQEWVGQAVELTVEQSE